jgi:hypothetical protein
MKSVSRWFTLVSAVAVAIVAAGCGSESMSGPSEVASGAKTEEQDAAAFAKAASTVDPAELEIVGFVKSVSAPRFTVGGRTVIVSRSTEITRNKERVSFAAIKVGEHVKVEGTLRSDGLVQAREVKVGYKGKTPNTLPNDRPGDDHGHHGNDDGPDHDANDDHGGGNDDGPDHDANDDHGNDGSGHN